MDSLQRIACDWCGHQSPTGAANCLTCGAPLDVKNLVSDSGWREAPRLRDMAEVKFGSAVCQVEGEIVPVAEITLGAGDAVFFEHHVLLWKDDTVRMDVMPLQGGIKRALAGLPFVVSIASGTGRVAFSRDASGELVVLPLQPGMELDVREHAFLLCSHNVNYSYTRIKGLRNILFGGQGMFMDRFTAGNVPGLLLLHGSGNVFVRNLAAGQQICIKPTSLLFKDPSVRMNLHLEYPGGTFSTWGRWANRYIWLRLTGPGRVAVQSHFEHLHDPGASLGATEPMTTSRRW